MKKKHTIAAYYFPNYHKDEQNSKIHGKNWDEWALVKSATPRFPGHNQPKKPLWGYEDEADPQVMAKKIDTASDYGIDTFLFDWYWHPEGPYLQKCLDEGFLKAPNNDKLKFALMWANHDWVNIHPAQRAIPPIILNEGVISPEVFTEATDHVINNYFTHPSYWKIEGACYFSFYEISKLMKNFGSVKKTKAGLENFRERAKDAGIGDLHLNAIVWGETLLPGEEKVENVDSILETLGFDSVTSYVWIHHKSMDEFPFTSYPSYRDACIKHWESFYTERTLPYYPNVTMGWDPSPRTVQSDVYDNLGYPFTPILKGNSPNEFGKAIQSVKTFLNDKYPGGGFFTINAWNEWTEGSYLEPDTENEYAYLEVIKDAFKQN